MCFLSFTVLSKCIGLGNFDLSDSYRSGRPTTLDNDMLGAEVEVNPCQTIEELSNTLNRPWSTVQGHLQQIGKVSRADVWVPHNLSEEDEANRPTTCNLLLQRHDEQLDRANQSLIENCPAIVNRIAPPDFHLYRSLQHFPSGKKFENLHDDQKSPSPDILLKNQLIFIDPALNICTLDGKRVITSLIKNKLVKNLSV
ncbi:Histone-lysine N-methyltransferase SETMAR [Melipona quadrifasciata]|uniref:Histone-lysine N-methyltransferase SETMAR n=1 Tax=Melipona quadrifasciata TaxID=166423 RepID=A0A0N0BFL2_9HYME|nr:Histone-lysine N-methyltransferase SETMAR [Melipona quadrifasciata]